MGNNASRLLLYMRLQLLSLTYHKKYKTSKRHFIRKSLLGFKNTATIILRMVKKSIKAELMNYYNEFDMEAEVPSRQAFSQAREKISFLAFKDFFDKSCELTINSDDARLWREYRLFAIDGTSFAVGKIDKLKETFGSSTTIPDKAMCRISAAVDVLNECIADAAVAPFSTGERALFIEQIKRLKNIASALYLFDRGYWSPELINNIIDNKQYFLMRLASNAGKTIVPDAEDNNCILRKFSFALPTGQLETLLTNLPEDEISDDELGELYTKRWGAETKYLELKDRLQIDSFSGESSNIVLQDIYSTLYISNLTAFICWEADEAIKKDKSGNSNLYKQKSNRSFCIQTLRARFVYICLLSSASAIDRALDKLVCDIKREVVYIDKSKPRPRDKRRLKLSRGLHHNSIL